jgi:phospholipase/lecithinase/hemolysin
MKEFRVLAAALAAAAVLAGCGGSDPGDQNPRVTFTRMISFGDSLSDVGSYRTAIIGANGEGEYSINGNFHAEGLDYTNWTEFLSATLKMSAAPCAAETGLTPPSQDEGGQLYFLYEAPVFHDTGAAPCLNYAQGGARVTIPYGPGNAYFWTALQSPSGMLGQLTVPIATQISNFLTNTGGQFTATDLVTVLGGGNDVFVNRATVDGTAAAVVDYPQDVQDQQVGAAAAAAVQAMTQAGTELAGYINTQIVAKGATHVVVVNLPDVSVTPDQAEWLLQPTSPEIEKVHPNLTLDMVNAFNTALATGLSITNNMSTSASILWVDAFTASDQQVADPAQFGLTNVTEPACELDPTQPNATGLFQPRVPISSALFCTKDTLVTDVTSALTYEFADTVHPTPYGYRLLAQLVGVGMAGKGWL